ncbi:tyrosine-type recombinase/integrase [Crocinitomicaceae bacterium]|nr:tyrosine-type recombinase/integrase [Crocinitomicaceae bacterium]MDG1036951.1 tyrosine-type recombinase/integrase [Crocinitomicaceae bacterium]
MHDFLNYLSTERRFSEHTCLAYKKDIEQFIEFSGVIQQSGLLEVEAKLIRGWIVDLIDNGYVNRSVNRKLSSLRTYFGWLAKTGTIDTNPMQSIKGPKAEKRLPSFAQQQEFKESKTKVLFGEDFDGVRDKLMFEVLYQTGIRSSELVNLRDVNVDKQQIKVLGKRNKERIIPIGEQLGELINRYRDLRKVLLANNDYFFVLNSGKKLYPKFVYRKINKYLGLVTDLEKKSPHVMRHTFATHMLNNGAGLEALKELLGHASLSATQIYTHNSFSEITTIYSQSHPRGHKK